MIKWVDYTAECPIEYFEDFINKYGLEHLRYTCVESEWDNIDIRTEYVTLVRVGYVTRVEYAYSEKLKGYCVRFECKFNRRINPKSFELRLSLNKDEFFLTVIE